MDCVPLSEAGEVGLWSVSYIMMEVGEVEGREAVYDSFDNPEQVLLFLIFNFFNF